MNSHKYNKRVVRPLIKVLISVKEEHIRGQDKAHCNIVDKPRRALYNAVNEATGLRVGVRGGYLIDTSPQLGFGRVRKFKLPDSVVNFLRSYADMQPFNFFLEEIENV